MATKRNTKASTKRSTKRSTSKKRSTKSERANPKYRATLSVFGEVQNVFEGDKALYLTIKVWNDSEYYSLINISVDYDLADEYEINEGDTIGVMALCSSFFEKRIQRVVPTFTAFEIIPSDDKEDEEDEEDDEEEND